MMKYIDRVETGLAIYNAIQNSGYTQADVSRMLGVSPCMVSRWATGRYVPDLEHLTHLADLLKVSMDDLVVRGKKK